MTKIYASLKAAAEDKDNEDFGKSVPTFTVDPRKIVVQDGFNARPIDPEHVAYMKELQRAGVDTGYLVVQMVDGVPILRDGHHRLAACKELIAEGLDIKRVKVMEFKGDEKSAILMMLATQSGKKYTPLQLGKQYIKLVNTFGMSFAEIATERGMSAQHVKDAIRLTEQPVELQDMIKSGEIAPATALRLVKKEGSGSKAVEKIKEASKAGVKVGKPITQKALDKLGDSYIMEATRNGDACAKHLLAMVDSPAFDAGTKATLRNTLLVVQGKRESLTQKPGEVLRAWLEEHRAHANSRVADSAGVLVDVLDNKKVADAGSPEAQYFGHMTWLHKLASSSPKNTVRAAAHWFCAVMEAQGTKREIAPAPSVLPLDEAIRAEMESGGAVRAETLCPEAADMLAYLRGVKS